MSVIKHNIVKFQFHLYKVLVYRLMHLTLSTPQSGHNDVFSKLETKCSECRVELQMQSPSISDERISDERIKEGTQSTDSRLRGGRPQSMQFDIPNDESVLKRKLPRDKGDPSVTSPMATRRRLSAPHTPSAPVQKSWSFLLQESLS